MEAVALAFSILFPIGDPDYELLSFPGPAGVKQQIDFNDAYREHLDKARSIHGITHRILWGGATTSQVWDEPQYNWYTETLRQAWELRMIWTNLSYAHDAEQPMHKRMYLERLREAIGDVNYRFGRMPPVVPTWRYRFDEN
jgi:hypothetical protein